MATVFQIPDDSALPPGNKTAQDHGRGCFSRVEREAAEVMVGEGIAEEGVSLASHFTFYVTLRMREASAEIQLAIVFRSVAHRFAI